MADFKTEAQIQFKHTFNGDEVLPGVRLFDWQSRSENYNVDSAIIHIAANASNATVTLPTYSDRKFTYFRDISDTTTGNITLKVNTSAARAVNIEFGVSGAITALTASNADATNAKKLQVITVRGE